MAHRCKSIRHKSIRHKNRTTLKRGGVPDSKRESKKAEKTSHKIEPSSIVYFPRTGKYTHDDDETDDEFEKEFKYLNSKENKTRIKRVHEQYQKEQLDKHMLLIPGIIQNYGARDENLNIENNPYIILTNPNNQYYFDILGIPLKEACSISNAKLKAKYEDIINHIHLHSGLKKFVDDARHKLYSQRVRISYANEIPWQKHQLKVREHKESITRFMYDRNTHSISSSPPPYEHQTLC